MSAETDAAEFDRLKAIGKDLGLHVERHKVFDPLTHNGGGDLYVQQRRAIFYYQGGKGNPPSLLRYATAERVREFLTERAKQV